MTTVAEQCEFCDLPLPSARSGRGGRYCCYGCYLLDGIVGGSSDADSTNDVRPRSKEADWILARTLLAAFLGMGVMVFSIVLYANTVFEGTGEEALGPIADLCRYASLVISLPALGLLAIPMLRQALSSRRDVASGPSAVSALIAIGSLAAFTLSTIHVVRGEGEVYFDTAVMLLLLVTLGRYLEARGRAQARASLDKLQALLPRMARLVSRRDATESDSREFDAAPSTTLAPETSTPEMVAPEMVAPEMVAPEMMATTTMVETDLVRRGDIIRIAAGERIPCDGVIVSGSADLDRSIVSGESDANLTESGDRVFAGSLCLDGSLDCRVESETGSRYLDHMASVARDAMRSRPRLARLADRASRPFLGIVLVVALGSVLLAGLGGSWDAAVHRGLAVLLIACPCSLGIAAPLAIHAALTMLARRGVLVYGGETLESLSQPGLALFDKTGTLTSPDLSVAGVVAADDTSIDDVLRTARRLAAHSNHPIATALRKEAFRGDDEGVSPAIPTEDAPRLSDVREHAGLGLEARVGDDALRLGSARFLRDHGLIGVDELERAVQEQSAAARPVFVGHGRRALGAVLLHESLRPETPSVVTALRLRGWRLEMLTGDTMERSTRLAERVGIRAHAELLPHEKIERMRDLSPRRRDGRRDRRWHQRRAPPRFGASGNRARERRGHNARHGPSRPPRRRFWSCPRLPPGARRHRANRGATHPLEPRRIVRLQLDRCRSRRGRLHPSDPGRGADDRLERQRDVDLPTSLRDRYPDGGQLGSNGTVAARSTGEALRSCGRPGERGGSERDMDGSEAMTIEPAFLPALIAALGGSLHCIGMCGALAFAGSSGRARRNGAMDRPTRRVPRGQDDFLRVPRRARGKRRRHRFARCHPRAARARRRRGPRSRRSGSRPARVVAGVARWTRPGSTRPRGGALR